MKFIPATLVSLALAAGSYGLVTRRDTSTAPCVGAQVVETSSVVVGDKTIQMRTFSCDAPFRSFVPNNDFGTSPGTITPPAAPSSSSRAGTGPGTIDPPSAPSSSSSAPAAAPTSVNDVCGEICSTVCADNGSLPPTTEDCATLVDAVTILNGAISPTFEVDQNHVQTLTFGTCQFFFENLSPQPMSYCWLSLAQTASGAVATCLPPVQPVNSEGICIPRDGLWRVGVAHA